MAKKSKYYLNNKELILELVKFKELGVASEELGIMFLQVANGLSDRSNFSGYTWKHDMVGEAVLTCIKYGRNFDESKSNNAFAYISSICYKSFIGYLNKQKKHSNIKDLCFRYRNDLSDRLINNSDKIQNSDIGIDYTILDELNKQEIKLNLEDELYEELDDIIENEDVDE